MKKNQPIIILGVLVVAAIASIFFFAAEVNDLGKGDLIRLIRPEPHEEVESPLRVEGEARGGWFFEATFPVRIEDEDGNFVVESFARALADWMTVEFVPFAARLEFEAPQAERGVLILEKANPSGLPEQADELRIPVRFSKQ